MKKIFSVFLCLVMLFSLSIQALSDNSDLYESILNDTSDYIYETVSNPQINSIGGEWAVIGLLRNEADIPKEYYKKYYDTVEKHLKECNGILSDRKYTEYSRVILALTAMGKNPGDVAGYNLLTPLGDYEKTTFQGINGSIWAIIALDSGNYEIPKNTNASIQATRDMYIKNILDNQNSDGGWSLSGDISDIDVTAMALQALSKYQNNEIVKTSIEKALLFIIENQNQNGEFSGIYKESSESYAQVIIALCELGIPLDDYRFVKNQNTMLDNMLAYYENKKGFKHTKDGNINQMATEQCFLSLVALRRFNEGKNSLYNMSDAISLFENNNLGLLDKNPDVKKMDIVFPQKTFLDIKGHKNQQAIEALAERYIINGKTQNNFEPDETMTRAEFATIVVKSLGLPISENNTFCDVTENDWFYPYVNTAYQYKIVNGVSDIQFNPNGTITREEASVMIARAGKLCGMNTDVSLSYARDILAVFSDYVNASDWSLNALAFCYDNNILSDDVMEIKPKEAVTRGEIAQMIYNMLSLSKLI